MQMKHDKKWKEIFAALVLIKGGVIQPPFSVDWLKDRPDLQIGEMGIEITEAVCDGEERSYADKMFNCDSFEEAEIMQRTNRRNDELRPIRLCGTEKFVVDYRARGYNESFIIECILSCIKVKQKKWANYCEFPIRCLYIKVTDDLLGNPNHPLDTSQIIEVVNGSIFDNLYLYLNHTLYVFERNSYQLSVVKFEITEELQIAMEACEVNSCPEEHIVSYRQSLAYELGTKLS